MKKKVLLCLVCEAVILGLAGCGSNDPLASEALDILTSNINNTSAVNSSDKGDVIPEIPVTEESAFKYEYNSEYGGMIITDYLKESPKVRIPDTLAGVPVKLVDLSDCEKEITQLAIPDSVMGFYLSGKTEASMQYINLPADSVDYNIWLQNYIQNTSQQNEDFLTESEYYNEFIDSVYYLFYGYENLIDIGVSGKNSRFCSVDGMLCYNYQDRFVLLFCPPGKSGSVTIPDNITEINASAFGEKGNGTYAMTSGGEDEGALNIIYKNKTYNSIFELDNIIKIHEDYAAIRAKVLSADSMARWLANEVNTWLADNSAMGGTDSVNGSFTISGGISPDFFVEKAEGNPQTLNELLASDFDFDPAMKAKIWVCDGKAVACQFTDKADDFPADVFQQDSRGNVLPVSSPWKDNGGKPEGINADGVVVGTYPKIMNDGG